MRVLPIGLISLVAVALAACGGGGGGDGGGDIPASGLRLGDPIEGLPPATLEAFHRGKALMTHRFTPSEGLGPFFNATSCAACHEVPVTGGSAPNYRNFFLAAVGTPPFQSPITTAPGIPSMVVPSFSGGPPFDRVRPTIPEPTPGLPVASTHRNAPSMLGVGLFEFVTDATIMGLSDPDDANGDGISGRFNRDGGFNVGRFGYKCQANNIESFIRGAAQNQMGMTSNPVLGNGAIVSLSTSFLPQVAGGQNAPTTDGDGVPDPELSTSDFADIIAFNKFLAPPQRLPDTSASIRGEAMFEQIGCTLCHLPSIPSSLTDLHAYTDLLIHDMGPDLADGISMGFPQPSVLAGSSTAQEWRTQPLWGVRLHAPYLHDGRSDTLDAAIRAHGGEGLASRTAYLNLSQTERDDIIAFLEIL
jgi:CxxC motif-containing protein (DUF1111 family)